MLRISNVKPQFTAIITTAEEFKEDYKEGGLVVAAKGTLKPWQTVVSVGPQVRDIAVGDKVMINFDRYAVKRYDVNSVKEDLGMNKTVSYNLTYVNIEDSEGEIHRNLLLDARDVQYVFEGEEIEEKKIIDVPNLIV